MEVKCVWERLRNKYDGQSFPIPAASRRDWPGTGAGWASGVHAPSKLRPRVNSAGGACGARGARCSLATPPALRANRANAGARPGHPTRAHRPAPLRGWSHPRAPQAARQPATAWKAAPEPRTGMEFEMLEKSTSPPRQRSWSLQSLRVHWAGGGTARTPHSGGTDAGLQGRKPGEERDVEAEGAKGLSPLNWPPPAWTLTDGVKPLRWLRMKTTWAILSLHIPH